MRVDSIILLLLSYMKVNKATKEDYENLKTFISNSNSFNGKKKKLYVKINKFKKKQNIK